jgi:hypothetical protein
VEDEDVSVWSELILHRWYSSSALALEQCLQTCLNIIEEISSKRKVIPLVILHLSVSTKNILLLLRLPLLLLLSIHILILILRCHLPLPTSSIIASIASSFLLTVLLWGSSIGYAIINSIGILANKIGVGIEHDIVIIAIESVGDLITRISKSIGVAVDLEVDVAVLEIE